MKNSEGPTGTHGCACRSRYAKQCASIRYGIDHPGEECECLCHEWDDEEDELIVGIDCCPHQVPYGSDCDACFDQESYSFSIVRAMENI